MEICRFYQQGTCRKGTDCDFAHVNMSVKVVSPPTEIILGDKQLEGLHPDRVALFTGRAAAAADDDVVLDMPPPPKRGGVGGCEVWSGFYGDEPIGQAGPPPSPFLVGGGDDHAWVYQARNTAESPPNDPQTQLAAVMGAQKRMSDGEPKQPIGPHPSFIRVSAQYQSQAAIDSKLQQPGADHNERSLAEAKEASLRLQGVQWIDVVRRALQLPVRTYTTAVIYYHKFRLAHPPGTHTGDNYLWNDAAAASLLVACKMEDTLKKSRDILAASFNLKATSAHDHLPSDDPTFEVQSRAVIGLERMVLEASTFDFRSRGPHHMLAKIAKTLGHGEEVKAVYDLAWIALTDLYRTFAPLKQTSVTLALSMLELAARLLNAENVLLALERYDLTKVDTTRDETMETILDSLDLYIQHTAASMLGTRYSLDDFLRLRLALKKECDSNSIPRNCVAPTQALAAQVLPESKVQNGHPTPVSPPQNGTNQNLPAPVRLEHRPPVSGGTLRFMLNPQLAHDERKQVEDFFIEEWEEYEEEIEVPLPRAERRQGPPSSRASSRGGRSDDRRDERERMPPRSFDDHRREERARVDRERERLYDRDRRPPPRESRRYEDSRRYPDDRDRRYDERPRYDDRRPPRDDRRYHRDDRDSRR